jgi:hypothetical protein
MIEVVVSLRDAVMASLLAWGGVGETQMAEADALLGRHPAVEPAVIEKTVEKPAASIRQQSC